ncbi:hypothetical protein ACQPYH_19935 [Kribbella sp. CA-245084]|uniref:hypothetical protein n=1 Tax=Kribbella sp. CA-245084 TaxID=3239940 RepID=UPI003D940BD7
MAASLGSRKAASRLALQPPLERQRLSYRARLLVILLIVLTIVAIAIAVAMARRDLDHDTLWYEIGKLVAQAGILTGFGALVSLLIHEFQQDQVQARQRVDVASQRLSSRNEWLRDFAGRVTDAYTNLKQARRRLQWALSSTADGMFIDTRVYEKQMRRISAVQAEFEALLTQAQTYFTEEGRAEPVESLLKFIENRLSELVSERKNQWAGDSVQPARVSLNDRASMRRFVAESNGPDSDFGKAGGFGEIKANYKAVLVWIITELRGARRANDE